MGEISAHHYFRDFYFCDSGIIPMLLVSEMLAAKSLALTDLVGRGKALSIFRRVKFFSKKVDLVINRIEDLYSHTCIDVDRQDGLSFNFGLWRFNIRIQY